MIVLGIVIVLLGLALIFARDLMWELTVMGNQFKGQTSERTELWDTGQIIGGVICLLLGVGLICAQISQNNAEVAEKASATATATSLQAVLNETFGPHLAEWQKVEREVTHSVRPRDIDVRASRIYYGRCENNRFYLYVMDFPVRYSNYAYVPNGDPEDCEPQGMSVFYSASV